MSDRDELAKIIFDYTGLGPFPSDQEYAAAEAILKSGYEQVRGINPPRVTIRAQALRILLHNALLKGAESRLYAVRKAVREAEAALGLDWMETANNASLKALTEEAGK